MSLHLTAVGAVVSVEPFPRNDRLPRAIELAVKRKRNDAATVSGGQLPAPKRSLNEKVAFIGEEHHSTL